MDRHTVFSPVGRGNVSGWKKMAICWGQTGTYDTEPPVSQWHLSLKAAALSCYWKLWLEALDKGFEGNEAQAWNDVTTLVMKSIPEDVRDDRDILSMMDMLALTYILPPEACYPSALCSAFHSHSVFEERKSSMEERTWWALTIMEAHLASPSHTKNRRDRVCEATPEQTGSRV
jgi:hypothetical protein